MKRTGVLLLTAGLLLTGCMNWIVQPLPANRIGRYVKRIVQSDSQVGAEWGIKAVYLRTGKTIVSFNAEKLFLPASNTKLYTTSAALVYLGPDYRYQTPVIVTGPVVDSTLQGDLVVVGMGDPTWSARFYEGDGKAVFRSWADSLQAHGIHTIAGDIVGIDGIFDDPPMGSGWMWDYEPYYYAAPIAGLIFNENTLDVMIIPQDSGKAPIIEPNPVTAFTTIENNLVTLDTLNNPDSLKARWDFDRASGTNHIVFKGIFPPDTVETGASIYDPLLFTITVMRETFSESGITVYGGLRTGDCFPIESLMSRPVGDTLFVHSSPPLSEIIYELNKASQNLMAEILLRTVGSAPDEGGSARRGLAVARPIWAGMGVDTNMVYLTDGSGLSRYNKLTPSNTVQLLTSMFTDTVFFRSLPIAGVDGTLERTMTTGAATGRVHAKTGTLRHARALSGYILNRKGEWIVFSIMINDYLTPLREVNGKIKHLCELLVLHT